MSPHCNSSKRCFGNMEEDKLIGRHLSADKWYFLLKRVSSRIVIIDWELCVTPILCTPQCTDPTSSNQEARSGKGGGRFYPNQVPCVAVVACNIYTSGAKAKQYGSRNGIF